MKKYIVFQNANFLNLLIKMFWNLTFLNIVYDLS